MTEHTQGRDAELLCPSLSVELTTPRAVHQCMAQAHMPHPRIKPGLVAPANNPTTWEKQSDQEFKAGLCSTVGLSLDQLIKESFKCLTAAIIKKELSQLKDHCIWKQRPPGFLRFLLTVLDASGRPVLPRIRVWLRPTAARLLVSPLSFLAVLMFPLFLLLFLLFSANLGGCFASVTLTGEFWPQRTPVGKINFGMTFKREGGGNHT